MARDHLRLRFPLGVEAVKRVENEIGVVARRPVAGDHRVQHGKIRDSDEHQGFRPIRPRQSGRAADGKRCGRGRFKQITSSQAASPQFANRTVDFWIAWYCASSMAQ
jgi:hypothetical protein